ncbi:twin-arginine translocation pathway signal protein [Rathayibacter caricis DSM 15933]|uniref:Thiamine pyrimidine synthase n=1 Tax=Rathayibacter caricis DSM 15933 TaxID=1328867 RepID=A0A2T4URY9_9MICO|nr:ABC transporter substrate-binding protein [Rathayibacter caricis]PTL72286.1 twin-arginine translocation pathway signal protein [Rathayibacter caricis DSM 15933]
MSRSIPPRLLRTAGIGLVAATAAALAGCSSSDGSAAAADDLTTVRVSLGWITNVEWAGFWLADANGYYEDEGLDIEWIGGGPNAPTTMATVAAGDADLGIQPGAQAWLASFADGNDWTAVGTVYQDSPSSIVSLADDPVTSAEDLVGKTVLGQEGTQIDYDAVFRVAGLEPDYEFLPAGFDIAPLVEGQGVAYTAYATNQPIMLEEQYDLAPDDYVVTLYSDLGLPTYGNIIYGDSAYVEDNADVMEGFLAASLRGWAENGEDPAVGAQLSVDEYGADLGLDLVQQTRENELQQPLVVGTTGDPLLWMSEARLRDEMYPGLEAAGYEDLPDPAEYVDMSYLEAAAARVE